MSYPTTYRLDRVRRALLGNCRVLVLGDSYAAKAGSRVDLHLLRGLVHSGMTAIDSGAQPSPSTWPIQSSEISGNRVVDTANYEVENLDERYSLPLRHLMTFQLDGVNTFGVRGTIGIQLTSDALASARSHAFTNPSHLTDDRTIRARLLYYAPTDLDNLTSTTPWYITQGGVGTASRLLGFRYDTFARRFHHLDEGDPDEAVRGSPVAGQCNAIFPDVTVPLGSSDSGVRRVRVMYRDELGQTGNALDDGGRIASIAGVLFYDHIDGEPMPGLQWSHLSDPSWNYIGFGVNAPSDGADVKRYETSDLIHYLDVSTIDQNKQPIVFVICDVESQTPATTQGRIADIITQTRIAFETVGYTKQAIVCPIHMHAKTDGAAAQANDGQGMYDAVREAGNCSFFSLYQDLDAMLFRGSSEARQWLRDNGYDAFEFPGVAGPVDLADGPLQGDLLADGTHPGGQTEAAFFADRICNAINGAPWPRSRATQLGLASQFGVGT